MKIDPTRPRPEISDFVTFLHECVKGTGLVVAPTGALPAQIDRLVSLARAPLPPFYRQFLEIFGANNGDILEGSRMHIDKLIKHYEADTSDEYPLTPRNAILISTTSLDGEISLVYPDDTFQTEPQVAISFQDIVEGITSSSFRCWAYRETFARYRWIRTEGARASLSGWMDAGAIGQVLDVASRVGLQPWWFSDSYGGCAEDAASWIACRQYKRSVSVSIGASTETRVAAIEAALRAEFPLVP